MKGYIISFTDKGDLLNKKISGVFKDWDVISCFRKTRNEGLKEWTRKAFADGSAIVFIGAAGIAVRAISQYIEKKDSDPAVIVCDELGKYAVPILSGHIGGANDIAKKICRHTGGIPVITTATDINGAWAADIWAMENNFKIHNADNIKYISSAVLRGEKVGLISDVRLDGKLPECVLYGNSETESGIVVSPYIKNIYKHTLNLIPKCMTIGAGSRKDADENALIKLFEKVSKEYNIDKSAVCAIATIDLKRNEKAVLKLRDYLETEIKFFSAEELNKTEGEFSGSEFVKEVTGTDNVCERCAVKAFDEVLLEIKKISGGGATLAIGLKKKV